MSSPSQAAQPPPVPAPQRLGLFTRTNTYRERYIHLLEQLDSGVLLVEPGSGTIVEASHSAGALTGLAATQLLGMSLTALLGHPTVPRLVADLVQLAPHETRTVRRITLATGRHATVDARFSVLVEAGEQRRLHVVLADVGELRRMESTLAQRSELLQSLAGLAAQAHVRDEQMPAHALATALAILHAPAGALYVHDDGALLRVATDAEPDSGMEFPCVLTSENAAPHAGIDLLPLPGDQGMLLSYSPAGTTRPPDPDVDAVRAAVAACLTAVVSAWQARERERQARAAYRRAQQLQDTLLEHVGTGVLLLDARGEVLVVNRPAARLLDYEIPEIAGMPYQAVLVARMPIDECIGPVLAGRAGNAAEVMVITRGGHEVPVRLSAVPLGPEQGAAVLVTLEDLSAHKEKNEQTRDLDRLTFLAEVSPVLAHEIRNPLASIHAGVQYMASKVQADDPLHETMVMIVDEIRRLNVLIADFLAAARPVELRLMPCMLSDLLTGLLAKRAGELERRHIVVSRQFAPDMPPALADRTRLEQVFANLIDNAIQAMGDRGQLTLLCGIAEGQASDGAPRVFAKVSDDGPGIAPEVKERIFQPFYTTKRGGSGLGLPISRRIVNAHNGMLEVESFPGVGTIFTVTLPAYAM